MSSPKISKQEWEEWKDNPTTQAFFEHLQDVHRLHCEHLCHGGIDLQKDGVALVSRIGIIREVAELSWDGYFGFYGDRDG